MTKSLLVILGNKPETLAYKQTDPGVLRDELQQATRYGVRYWSTSSSVGGVMKKDLESIMLTRQELQIMKIVWERGQATVKEVCEILSEKKPTAYTTILTFMGILEEKGALTHDRAGRAFIFKPLLTQYQATHNHVHDLIVRFFDGEPEKLIQNVLDNELTEPEQQLRVKSMLESRHEHQLA